MESSTSRLEAKTHSEQEHREVPDQSPAPGTESYVQEYGTGASTCHSLTAAVDQSLTGSRSSTTRAPLTCTVRKAGCFLRSGPSSLRKPMTFMIRTGRPSSRLRRSTIGVQAAETTLSLALLRQYGLPMRGNRPYAAISVSRLWGIRVPSGHGIVRVTSRCRSAGTPNTALCRAASSDTPG